MNPINSVINTPRLPRDPSALTKRMRIMMYFEDRLLAMRLGIDGYNTQWTAVQRKPLTKQEVQSGNAIALYDLGETKTQQMQFQLCELSVYAEFYHQMQIGEHSSDVLNMMLCDVQRMFREDVTCGGLAINVLEKKNQVDADGPLEKLVTGVVEFVVTYRHAADDPRR